MIGLGSNRLTVCRRGGMAITQAGRGGMEWLAGGRMPSWASPYSAQATAALKDAFTAAQWATIRDYGFAHPALVPFINEDPMLVMSLIDGLGERWLYNGSTGYFDLGIVPYLGLCGTLEFKLRSIKEYQAPLGSRNPYFIPIRENSTSTSLRTDFGSSNTTWGSFATNTKYKAEFTTKNGQQRVSVNGNSVSLSASNVSYTETLYLFAFNTNGNSNRIIDGDVYDLHLYDESTQADVAHFVPFKRNNTGELLDIVNLQLATKHGSFTISETQAS